jgi:putative endonuclease
MPGRNRANTRERGRDAEQIAVRHLMEKGYRIIDRNFVCKLGEIDIIANHSGDLVFVEVRSRHSTEALNPVYSVNRQKQKKIIRAAQVYLESRFPQTPTSRFDVVLVTLGQPPGIEIIPDAFSADDSRF